MSERRQLLTAKNLAVNFKTEAGWIEVVRGVDLEIGFDETVGLVGESGSGKSVTAQALMGILDKRRAIVSAEHLDLAGGTLLDRKGGQEGRRPGMEGIAMVFQGAFTSLNPLFRIGQVFGEVLRRHLGMRGGEARRRAASLLDAVRIPRPVECLKMYPHELSGGMQQRVCLALALATEPKLLIADEPTTALDVTTQAEIVRLLEELRREQAIGILFIGHDLDLVAEVASRVYVMYAGRVVETGDTDVLRSGRSAHPYTAALLRSTPPVSKKLHRLPAIAGTPVSPTNRPEGCPFRPRCSESTDVCSGAEPSLDEVALGQRAACYHPLSAAVVGGRSADGP